MNKIKVIFGLCFVIALSLYGADKVSRFAGQTLNQGGTSTTNGKTVIESNSPTNAFRVVAITATVTGALTTYTNTFGFTFLSTPTVVQGVVSGAAINTTPIATVTTSNLIITALDTNGVNNIPYLVYGIVRTGVFQ